MVEALSAPIVFVLVAIAVFWILNIRRRNFDPDYLMMEIDRLFDWYPCVDMLATIEVLDEEHNAEDEDRQVYSRTEVTRHLVQTVENNLLVILNHPQVSHRKLFRMLRRSGYRVILYRPDEIGDLRIDVLSKHHRFVVVYD